MHLNSAAEHPPVREIASGIYQIALPLSGSPITDLDHLNAYLIKGTHGWLLIDTGWNAPNTCQALDTALSNLKIRITDIETVVLTHSHPDHSGMTGRIKKLSPRTQFVMHHWEAALQEYHSKDFAAFQKVSTELLEKHGVPVDEIAFEDANHMPLLDTVSVADPDRLLFGGEIISTGVFNLEVIWAPGHSPGQICLYEPENQLLFSGDHILPGITPNIGFNNFSSDNPLGDYLYALGKFAMLPVKVVNPGHEFSFTGLQERINALISHHQAREAEISGVLCDGTCSAYEVASHLTWKLSGLTWKQYPPMHKRLATSEVIAHLEHMRWNGQLQKFIKSGHIFYSAI